MKYLALIILFAGTCFHQESTEFHQRGVTMNSNNIVAGYAAARLDSAEMIRFVDSDWPKEIYRGHVYFFQDSTRDAAHLFNMDSAPSAAIAKANMANWDAYIRINKNGYFLSWPEKKK